MGIRPALAFLALAAISSVQTPQTPTEPRPGRVIIDVVALDHGGNPVLDVKPSELEVWIVGYRVPIESLTFVNPTPDVPSNRSIALLLDDINVDPAVMPRAREAARQFVNRMVPEDRLTIATLSGASMEPS